MRGKVNRSDIYKKYRWHCDKYYQLVKVRYKRIREDGNEFPGITSHIFRHTFATRAIEEGMKPQVLKTILGHSSLAMTMDLYSHVLPNVKAEEMDKISGAF